MKALSTLSMTIIKEILQHGIRPHIIEDNNSIRLIDPIFGIERSRVTAEVCNTMMNLNKLGHNGDLSVQVHKLANRLIEIQNPDGSWNETHPNYNEPSVVFTSLSSLCLLNYYKNYSNNRVISNLRNAKDYLLSQQFSNGGFKKSRLYHIDALNADAMASTFLIKFGKTFNDDEAFKRGLLAIKNICRNQLKDGSYPYTTPKVAFPFKYHLNIPCIHYQAVTLYYLIHTYDEIKEPWLMHSIIRGTLWLKNKQNSNGSFNWYESGLNFALYLNATYAFTAYIYLKLSKLLNDHSFQNSIFNSLVKLKCSIYKGLLLRWEQGSWTTLPFDIFLCFRGGFIGNYPLTYKIYRSLQRIYREISRRRIIPDMGNFEIKNSKLATLIKDRAFISTVEPLFNYPDLYTTTQALEALSYTLLIVAS